MSTYFEDIEVGREHRTAARTITEADLTIYSGLSGDFNPLHTDEEFARTTDFGTRIAHGPLILAIAMGLISRMGFAEGTSLGFLAIEDWRFLHPVKIGDTISVHFSFVEKRPSSKGSRGILKRNVKVLNQRNEVVHEGRMVTLIMMRPKAGVEPG